MPSIRVQRTLVRTDGIDYCTTHSCSTGMVKRREHISVAVAGIRNR